MFHYIYIGNSWNKTVIHVLGKELYKGNANGKVCRSSNGALFKCQCVA